jgi:hypothetical protein
MTRRAQSAPGDPHPCPDCPHDMSAHSAGRGCWRCPCSRTPDTAPRDDDAALKRIPPERTPAACLARLEDRLRLAGWLDDEVPRADDEAPRSPARLRLVR